MLVQQDLRFHGLPTEDKQDLKPLKRLITSEQVVQHPYRVVLHGQQPEPVE